MGVMGGTERLKEARGEYDFAVDGGAIATLNLRGFGAASNFIPAGSYIMGGFIEVDTAVTSGGAATIAVNGNTAGDLLAAAAVSGAPWSTTGLKSILPAFTGATAVKTTADRSLAIAIAAATVTAGKFRVIVLYR